MQYNINDDFQGSIIDYNDNNLPSVRNWSEVLQNSVISSPIHYAQFLSDVVDNKNAESTSSKHDASIMKIDDIISFKNDKKRKADFESLDFTNCRDPEVINEVFPIPRKGGKNKIFPPTPIRTSVKEIKRWQQRMSRAEQLAAIEKMNSFYSEEGDISKQCISTDMSNFVSPNIPLTCMNLENGPCQGITLEFLYSRNFCDKATIAIGFRKLIGEAIHNFGTACSQGHEFPLDPSCFCGVLFNCNVNQKEVQWILKSQMLRKNHSINACDNMGFISTCCNGEMQHEINSPCAESFS